MTLYAAFGMLNAIVSRLNKGPPSMEQLTDSPGGPDPLRDSVRNLGQEVHNARKAAGMTVNDLARASGSSAGLISELERGLGNPSFTTLIRIAYGLGIPISTFITGPDSSQTATATVVHPDQRKRLMPTSDLVYELLTPDLSRDYEFLRVTMPPGFQNKDRPFKHTGEESVHLLSGTLIVTIADDQYTLNPGDTISYSAHPPHWYCNPGDTPALFLGIVCPPTF